MSSEFLFLVFIQLFVSVISGTIPPFIRFSLTSGSDGVLESTEIGDTIADFDIGGDCEGAFSCSVLDSHFAVLRVHANTFQLILSETLDREERTRIQVGIFCSTDEIELSKFVDLEILNVNDEAPEIEIALRPEFSDGIPRGTVVNTTVGDMTVRDRDGDQTTLTCRLYSDLVSISQPEVSDAGISKFVIRLTSSLRPVLSSSLKLRVFCTDNGTPPLVTIKNLTIPILIGNNREAVQIHQFSVHENEPIGTQIGMLDFRTVGINFTILQGESFPFAIQSGLIYTTASLDRESRSFYKFMVKLETFGGNVENLMNLTIPVVINVEDRNDNVPKFSQNEYYIQTRRQLTNGSRIPIEIHAIDRDSGANANISYSSKYVHIDSDRGLVVKPQLVDLIERDLLSDVANDEMISERSRSSREVVFSVTAVDGGTPPLSSSVRVHLNLARNNETTTPSVPTGNASTPAVSEPLPITNQTNLTSSASTPMKYYTLQIRENVPRNMYVARFVVFPNETTNYTLLTEQEFFRIDPRSGELFTIANLDRESKPVHIIGVEANSLISSKRSLINATLYVTDVNDNAPVFVKDEYVVDLYPGTLSAWPLILTDQASDADEGENGRITYSIPFGGSRYIDIVPDDGVILTKPKFEELLNGSGSVPARHEVTIRARDHGSPRSHYADTKLVIIIHEAGAGNVTTLPSDVTTTAAPITAATTTVAPTVTSAMTSVTPTEASKKMDLLSLILKKNIQLKISGKINIAVSFGDDEE